MNQICELSLKTVTKMCSTAIGTNMEIRCGHYIKEAQGEVRSTDEIIKQV